MTSSKDDEFNYNYPVFKPIEGVFSSRQLSEILYSLEGKRETPRKYGYFGKGVEYWSAKSISGTEALALAKESTGFNMFMIQYKLIDQTIDYTLSALKDYTKVNIIDVGCGNGWPVYPILKRLQEEKKLGKYIAVDIVKEMADLAINNLVHESDLAPFEYGTYQLDFEDGHFADHVIDERDEEAVNLFCFFSNTLGTMTDRHRALANIRDTMTGGDLLWIGNTLDSNAKELVSFYNGLEINGADYLKYHSDALAFFENFGMDWKEFGEVHVEHADQRGLVNYLFKITKGFELDFTFNEKHERLMFHPGDDISFVKLKNYSEGDLINELKDAGFKVKMLTSSEDYRAALVLVSVV